MKMKFLALYPCDLEKIGKRVKSQETRIEKVFEEFMELK